MRVALSVVIALVSLAAFFYMWYLIFDGLAITGTFWTVVGAWLVGQIGIRIALGLAKDV